MCLGVQIMDGEWVGGYRFQSEFYCVNKLYTEAHFLYL